MQKSLKVDETYQLWMLLAQTKDAMVKVRERELLEYDITPEQAEVMFIIQAIGERATPAEISRWLMREANSISELLCRMEKDGLIIKVKDLDRKNMVRVALTEKGQKASRKSASRKSVVRILSSLSEKERLELAACLHKLRTKAVKKLSINHNHHKLPFPLATV